MFYSWRTSQEWTRDDDAKRLSLTLILTIWLVSWAEDQFPLCSYFWRTVRSESIGLQLLFSKRKLWFVTGHRPGPVALFCCVSLWKILLSCSDHFFPLYKRTQRSVILLLNQDFNKVVIIVYLTFLFVCPYLIKCIHYYIELANNFSRGLRFKVTLSCIFLTLCWRKRIQWQWSINCSFSLILSYFSTNTCHERFYFEKQNSRHVWPGY